MRLCRSSSANGDDHAVDEPDPVAAIHRLAPNGVDRVIEVAFSEGRPRRGRGENRAVIAAYATGPTAQASAWPMLFDNVTQIALTAYVNTAYVNGDEDRSPADVTRACHRARVVVGT